MILSELIQRDLIKLDMQAADKWSAIEELVDILVAAHELRIGDRQGALEAVFERERSLSTGLEKTVAIPHGAVDFVGETLCCVGVSREGIPFNSLDGLDARLIVLLIIPRKSFQAHVRTLAGIARLVRVDELRERIIAARDPDEVMETVLELESREESLDEGAE